MATLTRVDDAEYARLLTFRVGLRRFLRWSGEQASTAGLTPAQHQLLLAIRGHPDPRGPRIGELAAYLCIQHHSAVQLVDRTEQLGLIARHRGDDDDRRVVRLRLTEAAREKLAVLSTAHLEELRRLASLFNTVAEAATTMPPAP